MNFNTLLGTDGYKLGHYFQYPEGTEFVYSNWTARKSRLKGVDKMVLFGPQYFCKAYLIEHFNQNFFSKKRDEVINSYKRRIKNYLGSDLPSYNHIGELHELGYLPLKIKALPEGSLVPIKVPCLTITNTLPEFFWLTNYIETPMSACIWQPSTSATIAYEFRKLLNKYAKETGMPWEFVKWQGHDFSFRGMSSWESAITSGMGHLLSFAGTDTIPAIDGLEQYYNADSDKELIGGSVPATEHSVMCAGEKESELETFRRLVTKVYPNGIVSIVSDTWDLWKVCQEYLPALKSEILTRNGKVVIRPDSGDPVKILCGDPEGKTEAIRKGVIELLWDVFGGTKTSEGYRLLDSHIGAIYGDSINLERAERISAILKSKGFASQPVYGIGSFTYQFNTRDTLGSAIKATYVRVKNKPFAIFKDPITDDGMKKSACGLLKVEKDTHGDFILKDNVGIVAETQGELKTIFQDGKLLIETSLSEIRQRLHGDKF